MDKQYLFATLADTWADMNYYVLPPAVY